VTDSVPVRAGEESYLPLVRPSLPSLDRYREQLEAVWSSRMLSNFATQVARLEAMARESFGVPDVLAVSSCDVGLVLAVRALEVPAGSEAILPSFTFNSTAHAVLWNGLRPRFVDVDPRTYALDPRRVAAEITPETGIVVATHIFGAAADVDALSRVAQEHRVPLLFDAAHAVGTRVDDRHVVAFGDASVISLSGTKSVTAGEGGLAVFADPAIAERFRYLRAYGFQGDYTSRYVGLNGKLSELHAALGCLTFPELEREVERRLALARRYRDLLADTGVGFQPAASTPGSAATYFAVELARRDYVAGRLAAARIEAKPYFRPLHWMPLFAGHAPEPLPETERLADHVLCLPLYADLRAHDLERVATIVREGVAA